MSQKNKSVTNNDWNIEVFILLILPLILVFLLFFVYVNRQKDNIIYEEQGSVFFYRAGAKFVRVNDGWLIISEEGHGMSFVQDSDWTMPGEVTKKKTNEKQEK